MLWAAWGFAAFIFYKVASALLLGASMGLSAAAVGGALAAAVLYAQSQLIAGQIRAGDTQRGVWLAVAVTSALMAVLMWLIVQGFDAEFAKRIEWPGADLLRIVPQFASEQRLRLVGFLVISAVPVLSKGIGATMMARSHYISR